MADNQSNDAGLPVDHTLDSDDASLVKWIRMLSLYGDQIRVFASFYRTMAAHAGEQLPMSRRVVEQLEMAASALFAIAQGADAWPAHVRKTVLDAVLRYETPRYHISRERRADLIVAELDRK